MTGALYDKMVAGLRAESKVYPIFSDQRQNSCGFELEKNGKNNKSHSDARGSVVVSLHVEHG